MALGGGLWFTQNKKLPGSYINFISIGSASVEVSARGVVAMGMALDWGKDGEIMTITPEDLQKNSMKLFGYEYTNEKLKGLRDLFRHARILYLYKLNSATTGKAANDFATALYSGARGNDLTIKIAKNADDTSKWDVLTYLAGTLVDSQTVAAVTDLKANDYVTFKTNATLAAAAGTPLTGGTSAAVTALNHQTFLDKIESYTFNAIGAVSDETGSNAVQVNALYAAFVKRMRDEMGVKFQAVLFNNAADHEGVVNVKNKVTDSDWSAASLVYWVTGVIGGVAVNASALNMIYDGEFTVDTNYTQLQLEAAIDAGEFTLHKVGNDVRVLNDQNSLVSLSVNKNKLFQQNQTIRVIDNIANDIATLFNTKYLGQIPNDEEGRTSLWADIVAHHQELQRIRAIQDFEEDDVQISAGEERSAVVVNDAITIVNVMAKLYMTCVVQ